MSHLFCHIIRFVYILCSYFVVFPLRIFRHYLKECFPVSDIVLPFCAIKVIFSLAFLAGSISAFRFHLLPSFTFYFSNQMPLSWLLYSLTYSAVLFTPSLVLTELWHYFFYNRFVSCLELARTTCTRLL